ncbi:MAG: DUF2796 domain-containing protein, partial [Glaciimonas sp.]|nr:DUF2796 domain-containing protein [Glaciimonas sp.]
MQFALSGAAISALLFLALSPAIAHEAHVHDVGKLDVAIDGSQLILHLDTPLANLVGSEHTTKSPKDRQATQQMARQLCVAGEVFVTTPAALCKPTSIKLVSAALDPLLLGELASFNATNTHAESGHADFVFQCAHPTQLHIIDVMLFSQFKSSQQIDAQIVT